MTIELVCNWASNLLMLCGSAVIILSSVGVLRLPDFYSRIHAASVTDTLGAALFVLALAIQTPFGLATGKLFMIVLFLVMTGPATTHALARTAHAHHVELPPGDRPTPNEAPLPEEVSAEDDV